MGFSANTCGFLFAFLATKPLRKMKHAGKGKHLLFTGEVDFSIFWADTIDMAGLFFFWTVLPPF